MQPVELHFTDSPQFHTPQKKFRIINIIAFTKTWLNNTVHDYKLFSCSFWVLIVITLIGNTRKDGVLLVFDSNFRVYKAFINISPSTDLVLIT